MAIDWSLGRVDPNLGTNVINSLNAGREQRRQRDRENALRTYAQGGGVDALIVADPALGMQARQYDQQQQVAADTRRRETEARHTQGTLAALQAAAAIPDPTDPAQLPAVLEQRRALIADTIRNRRDIWDDPADAERAIAAVLSPQAQLDRQHLTAQIQGLGGNPYEGAFNLGRGERRFVPGSSTPIAEGLPPEPPRPLVVTTPAGGSSTVYGDLSRFGGNQTDLSAPGVSAPPTAGGASNRPAPIAGTGPLPTVADARTTLAAIPGFRMTGGTRSPGRNAEVGGSPTSYHLRGQAIDFAAAPGVTRDQIEQHLLDAGLPITELFYEERRGNQGPHWHYSWGPSSRAAQPARQTAPSGSATGPRQNADGSTTITGPPGDQWVDLPDGGQRNTRTNQTRDRPPPIRPGRAPTPEERAQGIDWVAPNGEPHYPPASATPGGNRGRLSSQDSGFITARRNDARTARNMANLANEFLTLNRANGNSTGPGRMLTGPINMLSPGIRRMEAIANELTPLMRQGLPGAASDRDVAMFRGATVSTTAPGETNQRVAEAATAAAQRMAAYSQFFEWYAQQHGNLLGAQEEWDAYADANPMFAPGPNGTIRALPQQPWRQFFGIAAPARRGGGSASAAPTARPAAQRPPAATPAPSARPPRPTVGTVRNGYRYTGGDPGRRESWVAVR